MVHSNRFRRLPRALVLVLVFVTAGGVGGLACRAPTLSGPNYGPEAAPFRKKMPAPAARGGPPAYRLVLIGDAGANLPEDPTLELLGHWSDAFPERTTTVFLGDNLYPAGLQDGDRARGEHILRRQIEATRASKLFLPGNHDWGFTGRQWIVPGVVGRQQTFIESHAGARFRPLDGCPGPAVVELLEPGAELPGGLSIIALDLHWWLLPEAHRPPCRGIEDTAVFLERLREVLASHRGRTAVVAAHHPLRSAGPHGGQSRGFWSDLGIWLSYRFDFYVLQDIIEPGYGEMALLVSEVLAENPPLAVVAGHDHNLQVLDGDDASRFAVVSGAGSRVSRVTATDATLFAHAHLGFVVLDFYGADEETAPAVQVHVIETGKKNPRFTAQFPLEDAARRPDAAEPAPDRLGARAPERSPLRALEPGVPP